ncbi:MAG: aminoacyl-tRNA hydrolase [Pirellulaceae bacterium]|nr:aminoacyl-tRNA hydrolase [Pirellulaceae bacterium]
MKLIVGLGNPERRYQGTRHNVGFMVLAELARQCGAGRPKTKFHGEVVDAVVGGQKALLLSPLTYMNRSGISVHEARDFHKLPLEELLIVCDDLNLPLAKLRFRASGSAGGQKGLADIIRRLGSQEFARLRIGIGAPPDGWDAADYVLSRFTTAEEKEIETAVATAVEAVGRWAADGVEECMNRYNHGEKDS